LSAPEPSPRRWRPRLRRPSTLLGWALAGLTAMVLIVALALGSVRWGVLLPQGRLLIEARASGVKLGRLGKLKLEGLGGDVWRRFTVRRMTISDEKGVWLEARDLDVRWSYAALLGRRMQVDEASAGMVQILRRPTLAPKGPPSAGLPVTFEIRKLRFPLATLPAFSTRPGLYDVVGRLSLERQDLGQQAALTVKSRLHPGDFLDLQLDVGRTRPLLIKLKALEAKGGAIAGAIGLPADRPFSIDAHAEGSGFDGRVDLETRSGEQRPAWVHGGWTREGGAAAGRLSLAASSLTSSCVRMFGPEAVVALAGRRSAVKTGDAYGVALLVKAQNLALAAQGPAEPSALRSAAGLQVALLIPDFSRVMANPKAGAVRLQGKLTGEPSDWRFLGTARAEDLRPDGYRLASAAGPIELAGRGKQLTLKASLSGSGGSGAGTLAGLIGTAPKASVDVLRLADGRLLIRKAEAEGEALKLTAAGSAGLFGALSFKGELVATNLAKARPGAAGTLRLGWSAVQAGAAKPWLLTADGAGRGFKSGLSELDRLLGPEPRLKGRAAYANGVFMISAASLDGAKAGADAQGKLDPRGPLALEIKWRAEGPFQAGPVQISGKAAGRGALAGALSAPRADLSADFAAIDIPNLPLKATHVQLAFAKGAAGYDGQIAAEGESPYGPARAKAGFRFANDGLDLKGIDADAGGVRAAGALALRGSEPSTADLQLAIGPGALLSQGSVAGSFRLVDGAAPTASVSLQAQNAVLKDSGMVIRAARLTGSGPLSRLPFQLSADASTPQGPLSFNGAGVYQKAGEAQLASLTGSGAFRKVAFNTIEPVDLKWSNKERAARFRVALGGGQWTLDARQAQGAVTASSVVRGVDLKAINADFAGSFDADVALQGRRSLSGTMTARLQDARSIDAPAGVAVNAQVRANLQGERLSVEADASGAKGLKSTLSVELPVEASVSPLRLAIVKTRPMRGRLQADGEVQPLWDLFYGGDRQLAGQVHLAGELGGTLNDPQITGQAQVTGGRMQDYATGLVLTNLNASAELKRQVVSITAFSAKDEKGGALSGSGTVSLERGGGSDVRIELQKFRLIDNDEAEATATGVVALTRSSEGAIRNPGDLRIDRAEINAETRLRPSVVSMDVIEKNRPEQLGQQRLPTAARGPPVNVDLTLRAPRRVFVKGRGVDVELSLNAHVTGSLANPQLDGSARVFQGSYDFAGKRFQFDESGAIYLASELDQIRLDLSATETGPSLTATVRIRGTAAKPVITLTSSPSLPQEEILSQVLFGTSATQLSGAQTAQLASTVTALATGGGFDVMGSLRQFTRLDRLVLGGDQTSGVTVAGGKYIGDNVYLEIVGGGRYGPSVDVEWRIRRSLSLVSQLGEEFGAKLSIRWSRDLGGRRRTRQAPVNLGPAGKTAVKTTTVNPQDVKTGGRPRS
jgi:translocation and assembly module TamB